MTLSERYERSWTDFAVMVVSTFLSPRQSPIARSTSSQITFFRNVAGTETDRAQFLSIDSGPDFVVIPLFGIARGWSMRLPTLPSMSKGPWAGRWVFHLVLSFPRGSPFESAGSMG